MRKKVIAGNWKMNKTPVEVITFMRSFVELMKNKKTENEIVLCVPYIDVIITQQFLEETNVKVGVQNVHFAESGAYTGEISPRMLDGIGVEYVIIGHSERRQYFNETDESVNKKLKAALAHNLKPIVCVGESLDQRTAGVTKEFVTSQVRKAFEGLSAEDAEKTIIAYEPIWAIGTGKTASKEDANEVCKWIRGEINTLFGNVSENIIIQYGGSVKAANAAELFNMPDIDGGLVGGASLDPEEFFKIVNFDA